jgi:UDP-N-acetylmuramyl tripeptide synthase
LTLPDSFSEWRQKLRSVGAVPIIAVAGSRGKSTVIRVLDAIFQAADLRTATWTDMGVEIRGRRQRGELGPWSRALERLAESRLDVAIQELDWSTVRAVGLPKGVYPVLALTNVCVNNDQCMIHDEARRAMMALPSVLRAVHPDGVLVLNGEDYAVSGEEVHSPAPTILVAQSHENPLIRAQLQHNGTAAWVDHGEIVIGADDRPVSLCRADSLPIALGGEASFQLMNVMVAASAAYATGIAPSVIREALAGFTPNPMDLPGSFNLIEAGGVKVIVDRPDPSWFLRPVTRVVRDIPRHRLITVAGQFSSAPVSDVQEIGRLLGRVSSAIIVHSQESDMERSERLRQGVAMNDVPPVVIRTTTERRAVNRALRMARPGDALLILAEQAPAVLRAVMRAASNPDYGTDDGTPDS